MQFNMAVVMQRHFYGTVIRYLQRHKIKAPLDFLKSKGSLLFKVLAAWRSAFAAAIHRELR